MAFHIGIVFCDNVDQVDNLSGQALILHLVDTVERKREIYYITLQCALLLISRICLKEEVERTLRQVLKSPANRVSPPSIVQSFTLVIVPVW